MSTNRKLNVKLAEICDVLGVDCPIEDRIITKIAHIKRNIEEGCVYFAFRNWRVDTYANVEFAMEKKVALIITERDIEDYPCVVVENSLEAFMKIARWYRDSIDIDVVGITGSIGKTSTKEMLYSTLSAQDKIMIEKSAANSNSADIAPMNLLNLKDSTKVLIQEMAIKNIKDSSNSIRPTYAVVTNIGVSHIEEFGSREQIYHHKLEIMSGMKGGKVFLNIDDDMLAMFAKETDVECITYAIENEDADCKATDIKQTENGYEFVINYKGRITPAQTICLGKHNVLNALVAFAIGCEMGIEEATLVAGIKAYQPTGYRQNLLQVEEVSILADCFNAAPKSMKAALDTLESMETTGKKVAVLGDMLEMGSYSKSFHEEVGKYVNSKNIDALICYGNESKYIYDVVKNDRIKVFHTVYQKELISLIKEFTKEKNAILFKASHGMMLEEVIDKVFGTSLSAEGPKDVYVWDWVEREGKDVKAYLQNLGHESVAVYGLTTNGENLIKYLNKNGVDVAYAIDKRAKYAPHELYSCPIYTLEDELPPVDAILISHYSNIESIVDTLKDKVDAAYIPYRKMVEEMLEL